MYRKYRRRRTFQVDFEIGRRASSSSIGSSSRRYQPNLFNPFGLSGESKMENEEYYASPAHAPSSEQGTASTATAVSTSLNPVKPNIVTLIGNTKESILQTFKEARQAQKLTDQAMRAIDEEYHLMEEKTTHFLSPAFRRGCNRLNAILQMPSDHSIDDLYLETAEKRFDELLVGMKRPKEALLAKISSSKSRGTIFSTCNSILCLYGDTGVGKTCLAKALAEVLKREFAQIDFREGISYADLFGDPYSVDGSRPGKIVQCLQETGRTNPLIFLHHLNEVKNGGLASTLRKVLDKKENSHFFDRFLGLEVDLSEVLFVVSTGMNQSLPDSVYNLFEFLYVEDLAVSEKIEITKTRLIPRAIELTGIPKTAFELPDSALLILAQKYSRENGVQELFGFLIKMIENCGRQFAKKKEKIIIDESKLIAILGHHSYRGDELLSPLRPGVVLGLTAGNRGGVSAFEACLKEELNRSNKAGNVIATGNLAEVLQESVAVAHTFARKFFKSIKPNDSYMDAANIHLHIPDGAVRKDGCSAGITIVSAFLSLALDKPIRAGIAMTGQIGLLGDVLPVGGIRQKISAAKRAGISIIILPAMNSADFDGLLDVEKAGVTPIYAKTYIDVYNTIFKKG